MKYRISGKLSLLWLLCLALILYLGIVLVKNSIKKEDEAVSVFTSGTRYEGANIGFFDLMG